MCQLDEGSDSSTKEEKNKKFTLVNPINKELIVVDENYQFDKFLADEMNKFSVLINHPE